MAISKNTIIAGNHRDDDNGPNSGSAYLYDASTGAQIAKLTPGDGAERDFFGYSVGISGNVAIVGSYQDDDNGSLSGSAYLFDARTGVLNAKITPEDGAEGDWFGRSVAVSGNTAIVGSSGDDDNGNRSGAAYLFDVRTGSQISKLKPADGAPHDWFGYSVAISGNTAIVGSYSDDDNGSGSGAAYLFDARTGSQISKLRPADGAAFDSFGISVAVSGNIAIVGSYRDDDNGTDSGSAYLFDASTGAQIAKLTSDDGAEGDWFGRSVAMRENTAIVGSPRDDDNGLSSGSTYLFEVSTGAQIAKITPGEGAEGDWFGYSVAYDGNTAIVGTPRDDDNGSNSGSAYVFSGPNGPPASAINIIKDGEFENDPNRSGPWSVVATGDVDVVISSELAEEASEDTLPNNTYLTINSQTPDDQWTLGQLIGDVGEFGEYQLSFSARSKKGSDLVVALKGEGYGDVDDPYFLPPTTFNLTSRSQDFTVNFNIDDRFKRLDHLLIAIGNNEDLKENESIDIDHIVLWNRLGAETPMPQKPTELKSYLGAICRRMGKRSSGKPNLK